MRIMVLQSDTDQKELTIPGIPACKQPVGKEIPSSSSRNPGTPVSQADNTANRTFSRSNCNIFLNCKGCFSFAVSNPLFNG